MWGGGAGCEVLKVSTIKILMNSDFSSDLTPTLTIKLPPAAGGVFRPGVLSSAVRAAPSDCAPSIRQGMAAREADRADRLCAASLPHRHQDL